MKRIIPLLLGVLFFVIPYSALAAIARDSSSTSSFTSQASATWSHTVSGSNTILLVWAYTENVTVTGITYNGTAMTSITSNVNNTNRHLYSYYMVNPTTGAHNVVASFSGTGFGGGVAASYTGAAQTGQPDASSGITSVNTTVTSLSTTITTVTANDWIAGGVDGGCTTTTHTGSGVYASTPVIDTSLCTAIVDTNGAVTPPGSKTVGAAQSSSDFMSMINVAIAPLATPATPIPGVRVLFNGVKSLFSGVRVIFQ